MQSSLSLSHLFFRAILTASYAGTLSLHSSALPPPSNLTFSGHDLSALSCCYVPHPLGSSDKHWVASGGMDRVGRVWEYEVGVCARSRRPLANAFLRLLRSPLLPRTPFLSLPPSTLSTSTPPPSPLSALAHSLPRPPPLPRRLMSSPLGGMASSESGT